MAEGGDTKEKKYQRKVNIGLVRAIIKWPVSDNKVTGSDANTENVRCRQVGEKVERFA